MRGLARGTSATGLIAVNGDFERSVVSRSRARLFRDVRLAVFADAGFGNGDIPPAGGSVSIVADAGLGIRIAHCIGQTSFITSLDFPVIVTRPRLAIHQGGQPFGLRWVVSTSSGFITGERPVPPGPRQAPAGCR